MTITNTTPAATAADTTRSEPTGSGAPTDLANKNTFLQLLVAQLQNQDPMNPADGTEFVTQLASFSQLEQTIAIRQGIEGLRSDLTVPPEESTQSN